MKKKNKKAKSMVRIIVVIILCAIFGVGAYFGTLAIDNLSRGGDVKMTVTFDDTETYIMPNNKKLDKSEALKEWPYIMEVKNDGNGKALYQIIIEDVKENTIKRDSLEYVLMLNDKEITSGKLKDIKENILYTGEIDGKTSQKYKLYIWSTEEFKDDDKYEYKLTFNTIKYGGPGF